MALGLPWRLRGGRVPLDSCSSNTLEDYMTRLAGLILTGVATFTLGAAAPVPPHGQQTYGRGAGLATLTIPQGTDIPVTLDVSVMVKPDQVGNTFPAHITRDLVVEGAV